MTTTTASPADGAPAPVSAARAFAYWLRLGFLSFGGPAGQIAVMHQELVDALDAYADAQDPPISRTRALEHLLAWALNAAGYAPKAA